MAGADTERYGLWEKGSIRLYEGSPFAGGQPGSQTVDPNQARLLAPCQPSKIVAVGRNYAEHAAEFNNPLPEEPLIFLKPPTSIIAPGQEIVRPAVAQRVDHESELGVVIGRQCHGVSQAEALDYVLGYTCLNDVTERVLQRKDVQFTRGKGFDTFCPLGPVIALDLDPADLTIRCLVNGQVRQASRTASMIFPVAKLVSFISEVMTLLPGDVIATGTPEGVGPLVDGDEVTVEVQGIGRLVNPVRDLK